MREISPYLTGSLWSLWTYSVYGAAETYVPLCGLNLRKRKERRKLKETSTTAMIFLSASISFKCPYYDVTEYIFHILAYAPKGTLSYRKQQQTIKYRSSYYSIIYVSCWKESCRIATSDVLAHSIIIVSPIEFTNGCDLHSSKWYFFYCQNNSAECKSQSPELPLKLDGDYMQMSWELVFQLYNRSCEYNYWCKKRHYSLLSTIFYCLIIFIT